MKLPGRKLADAGTRKDKRPAGERRTVDAGRAQGATEKVQSGREDPDCHGRIKGDHPVAELCRREGISANIYYQRLKEFMEARALKKASSKNEETASATVGRSEVRCLPSGRVVSVVREADVRQVGGFPPQLQPLAATNFSSRHAPGGSPGERAVADGLYLLPHPELGLVLCGWRD